MGRLATDHPGKNHRRRKGRVESGGYGNTENQIHRKPVFWKLKIHCYAYRDGSVYCCYLSLLHLSALRAAVSHFPGGIAPQKVRFGKLTNHVSMEANMWKEGPSWIGAEMISVHPHSDGMR